MSSVNFRNSAFVFFAVVGLVSLVAAVWTGSGALVTLCCIAGGAVLVLCLAENASVIEGTYKVFGSEASFKKAAQAVDAPLPPQLGPRADLSPSDFGNLGEMLWYLSSPGLAHVDSVDRILGEFAKHVERCGLPNPQRAVAALKNLRLIYDTRTGIITQDAGNQLYTVMATIRGTLFSEADGLYAVHRK